jgi:CheY-like chemotaxis protein
VQEPKFGVLLANGQQEDRFLLRIVIRKRSTLLRVVGEAPDAEALQNYLTGAGQFADRNAHPFPDLLILDSFFPSHNRVAPLDWVKQQDFPDLKIALVADALREAPPEDPSAVGVDFAFAKPTDLASVERLVRVLEQNLLQRV